MNEKKLNNYLSLCTQVYDLSKPKPPKDIYTFYRTYVKEAKGLVLEPMCGTGRFLLPLIEEGFDVHGFDASTHMLQALHVKAANKNLTPSVWMDFTENLNRSERYSLIFIPSGSFCLITDPVIAKASLKAFYEHLVTGGILLFEVETSNTLPELGTWRGSKWTTSDNKTIILSQFAVLENNICSAIGKYELVKNSSIVHTEIEEYKIRIYQSDELILILREIGFKEIKVVKKTATNDNDKTLIYECKKE